jgi:hypothetical protein
MTPWSSLSTWGDVLKQITAWKSTADNPGPNQLEYIRRVYGMSARVPNRCPSVKLRQDCTKTGWVKELPGAGTYYSGQDYNLNASFIEVPSGATAILTNADGRTERVVGPDEFSFCSRDGFNDNVRQILVYGSLRPPI